MYNLSNQSASCLFREHLLSRLFEIRATLVIKLLFCVRCSSLSLRVLQWLSILVLVSRRSLLYAHHSSGIANLIIVIGHTTHTSVHSRIESLRTNGSNSTLSRNNRRLGSCCLLHFWLLPNNIKHTIFEGLFIFTEPILLPGVIQQFDIEVVSLHTFVEQAHAIFVVRILFKFQTSAILHIFFEFNRVTAAQLIERRLQLLFLNVFVFLILVFSW